LPPCLAGYDWNKGVNYKALLETYRFCGFQATNFGLAVDEVNKMVCSNMLNKLSKFDLLYHFHLLT
jgi:deoxyhypusine synthase